MRLEQWWVGEVGLSTWPRVPLSKQAGVRRMNSCSLFFFVGHYIILSQMDADELSYKRLIL